MRHRARSLDHLHAVRRASTLGAGTAAERLTFFVCFVDLPKTYDSVNRELLWRVLARCCGEYWLALVPIGKYHNSHPSTPRRHATLGMHGRRGASGLFRDTQGLRAGGVVPLLLRVFLAAAIGGHSRLIQQGRRDPQASGTPRGGAWDESVGSATAGTSVEGLHADEANFVSGPSSGGLFRVMTHVVEMFGAFGMRGHRHSSDPGTGKASNEGGTTSTISVTTGARSSGNQIFSTANDCVRENGELTQEINQRRRAA